MPDDLRQFLDLFLQDIAEQADGIASGHVSVDDWQKQMAQSLLVFHYASYQSGRNTRDLAPGERGRVNEQVGEQLDYLNRFAAELDQRGWQDKDAARAALYAGSIKPAYWRGKTYPYELPAYPGDGSTPCLVNCHCSVEIQEIDPEELSADVYWRLGAVEHCSKCVERSQQWSPLRFRGGELV